MILQSYVEQVMTMCRNSDFYAELFPLDSFRCNFVSAVYLEYPLEYNHDTSKYVEQVMAMCGLEEWHISLLYVLCYFPLMVSNAIPCPVRSVTRIPFRI